MSSSSPHSLRPHQHEFRYLWNCISFYMNWPSIHTKPLNLLTETTYFDTALQSGLIHTHLGEKICSFKNVWIHVDGHRLSSIFSPLLFVFFYSGRRSKVSKIRSAASIYAHTPVCACTVEIWKKHILYFLKKPSLIIKLGWLKLFALYWCLCVNISFIIPYADGVTGLFFFFFPVNTVPYRQH